MAYYYPEGYFGPICDDGIDDTTLAGLQRSANVVEDERVLVYDGLIGDDYITILDEPVLKTRKCKQRPDGTYYDCIDDWLNYQDSWDDYDRCLDPNGICYPWKETSQRNLRLEEDFFIPDLGPESCSPFDADINIRPTSFFSGNGELVTYNRREKSKPPTFPVTSTLESVVAPSTITASWSGADLVVNGTGSGLVRLEFEFDDNPNTYGQALSTFRIGGHTFVQTAGVESGSDSAWISVDAGQNYAGIINGGDGYGGYSVQGNKLCFRDLDGNDCNASLTIAETQAQDTVSNSGYWSELGNSLAVWVNPQVCTLPLQEQSVTYTIPIEATDEYTFQVGCDDTMRIFLFEEDEPFMDVVGGIFSGGSYSTPYTAQRTLQGGTNLIMTVNCTNSAAGFVDSEGSPYGKAYSWDRNPGGWFVQICRGGACQPPTNVQWVRSGPSSDDGWNDFMDTYAVYPSNSETLGGIAHEATWYFDVPYTGNYVLEYGCDDKGTWSLDGNLIVSENSSVRLSTKSYTMNNLTAGSHSMTCTIENLPSTNWAENPAGIAWTIRPAADSPANVDVTFSSNGNIVTTGDGVARVVFLFEYDDNPNTNGKAMDSVRWGGFPPNHEGLQFTQHNDSDGSVQSTITMEGGKTHPMTLLGNDGGFVIQDNGKKICYRDADGDDCNAYVRITGITQTVAGPQDPANIIARSTDLTSPGGGNTIWTTRDAVGYEYYETT